MPFDFEDFPVYKDARGSVYECAACLDIMDMKNMLMKDQHKALHASLNDLARQLSALIK